MHPEFKGIFDNVDIKNLAFGIGTEAGFDAVSERFGYDLTSPANVLPARGIKASDAFNPAGYGNVARASVVTFQHHGEHRDGGQLRIANAGKPASSGAARRTNLIFGKKSAIR